jgi:hypothetical protein
MYNKEPDFEADITIYSAEEAGRIAPARNGIRWDFRYASDDESDIYMIWPVFITDDGELVSQDIDLIGRYCARMYIVDDSMKEEIHRKRIKEGAKFYMVEGFRKVAEGIVTRILGLYNTQTD